jgi:hypothetical protein
LRLNNGLLCLGAMSALVLGLALDPTCFALGKPKPVVKTNSVTAPKTTQTAPAKPILKNPLQGLPLMESMSATPTAPQPPTLTELSQRIQNEISDDEPTLTRDLSVLWQAAVERNSTVRYAIEKLSRRDATGKQAADPWSKRLISSLVNIGGVAGSVLTQSPVGVLGSGVVQEALAEGPPDPNRMPVTDADMVILAKSLEQLQTQLFQHYLVYMREKRLLALSQEAHADMLRHLGQNNTETADTLMNLTQADVARHKQAFTSARNALALVASQTAVLAIEQPLPQDNASKP